MFESLVGHPPFGGDTDIATAMARLTTSAPAIRAERPEVSQALDDVIHRCLARQPEARFGSAAAVRDALDRARLDPTGSLPRPVAPTGTGPARPVAAPGAHPPPHTGPTQPTARPRRTSGARPRRRRRRLGVALGHSWSSSSPSPVASSRTCWSATAAPSDGANGGAGAAPPTASKVVLTADRVRPARRRYREPRRGRATPIDGDPTTSWTTEQYDNFPDGAKNGVGLAFDARRRRRREQGHRRDPAERLGRVDLRQRQVAVASSRPSATGVRRATHGSDLERTHTFDVGGVKGALGAALAHPAARGRRTASTTST